MWHVGSSIAIEVDSKLRIFGSILYEEMGSDEVKLSMYSAFLGTDSSQEALRYP